MPLECFNSTDEQGRIIRTPEFHTNENPGQYETHGVSYLGMRNIFKDDFGDEMGFDRMTRIDDLINEIECCKVVFDKDTFINYIFEEAYRKLPSQDRTEVKLRTYVEQRTEEVLEVAKDLYETYDYIINLEFPKDMKYNGR
jgi:hypothetical protein